MNGFHLKTPVPRCRNEGREMAWIFQGTQLHAKIHSLCLNFFSPVCCVRYLSFSRNCVAIREIIKTRV